MKILTYFATAIVALGLASIPVVAQSQQDAQQQQSAQPQAAQSADPSAQQTQAFTGKIVKTSDGLALQDQASSTTYKLDNQSEIKGFSGKKVKVTGTLDSTTNTIHVSNIELASKSY